MKGVLKVKLATNSVASLLLVTAVAVVPGVTRRREGKPRESQFDRILQHHDRKAELRADILGMTPLEFRELHKKHTFDEIIKSAGFKSVREFRLALFGKLRDELLHRGWTRQKIDEHVTLRSQRMN